MSPMNQTNGMGPDYADLANADTQGTKKAEESVNQVIKAGQQASEEKLEAGEDNSNVVVVANKAAKSPAQRAEIKTDKAKQAQESVLVRKEEADGLADGFSKRQDNKPYQLDSTLLSQLAESIGKEIKGDSTYEEIVSFIRARMVGKNGKDPDVTIIDKTFEFLIYTTTTQINRTKMDPVKTTLKVILNNLVEARQRYFADHSVNIDVGHKIIGAVDSIATNAKLDLQETLGRYRDVVHNPPDLQILRKQYETMGYKLAMNELKGLNHFLGANFKRKNLENAELSQLAQAAKTMQAFIGVCILAKSKVATMLNYLVRQGILVNIK